MNKGINLIINIIQKPYSEKRYDRFLRTKQEIKNLVPRFLFFLKNILLL